MPNGAEQIRPFAVHNNILRELADVQIEDDQVIDVVHFASRKFVAYFLIAGSSCDDFPPDFSRQGVFGGRWLIPAFAPLDQTRFGGIQPLCNIAREREWLF